MGCKVCSGKDVRDGDSSSSPSSQGENSLDGREGQRALTTSASASGETVDTAPEDFSPRDGTGASGGEGNPLAQRPASPPEACSPGSTTVVVFPAGMPEQHGAVGTAAMTTSAIDDTGNNADTTESPFPRPSPSSAMMGYVLTPSEAGSAPGPPSGHALSFGRSSQPQSVESASVTVTKNSTSGSTPVSTPGGGAGSGTSHHTNTSVSVSSDSDPPLFLDPVVYPRGGSSSREEEEGVENDSSDSQGAPLSGSE